MMGLHAAPAAWQVIAGIIIFLIAFAFIISGVVHRAYAAWGGAILMLLLGIETIASVWGHHLAWQTILLYLSLLIMAGITGKSGLLTYIAVKLIQKTKGKPFRLLTAFVFVAAAGAAILDSISMVLILVPLALTLSKKLGVPPAPFIVAVTMAANLGGTVTMIGTIPNLIIGTAAETALTFNDFWLYLSPVIVLVLLLTLLVIRLWYAKAWDQMKVSVEELLTLHASSFIPDKPMVFKVIAVWGIVLAGFIAQPLLHVPVVWIALIGAAALLLLCWRENKWKDTAASVDWGTLTFLLGLFILVGGLVDAGVMNKIAIMAMELSSGNPVYISMLLLWVSGIVTATLDPVTYTAAVIPLIHPLIQHMELSSAGQLHIWLTLALGIGLGSNATLLGSPSNIIAAGLAIREGHPLTFTQFMKIGALISLLSLLLATVYVLLFWL